MRVTVFTRDRTLVRLAWIMQHYIPSGLVQQKDRSRALRGRGGGGGKHPRGQQLLFQQLLILLCHGDSHVVTKIFQVSTGLYSLCGL